MNRIKIEVAISDKKYREDLIRRLAELAPGLEYIVSEDRSSEDYEADFMITEDIASEYFPVSLLAEKIEYELGDSFYARIQGSKPRTRTYVVRSRFGGSGCTAAGLTIARVLAGRSGAKTAFISSSYIYNENIKKRSCRELSYLLGHGINAEPDKFSIEDRYGVSVFPSCSCAAKLTELLRKKGFSAIVTDAGAAPDNQKISGHVVINIEAYDDIRSCDFERQAEDEIASGSSEFYVYNRAPCHKNEGHLIRAAYDDTSFIYKDGKIEIAMDGMFAASMRDLVSAAEEELDDGQSDFYK